MYTSILYLFWVLYFIVTEFLTKIVEVQDNSFLRGPRSPQDRNVGLKVDFATTVASYTNIHFLGGFGREIFTKNSPEQKFKETASINSEEEAELQTLLSVFTKRRENVNFWTQAQWGAWGPGTDL